jgi:DNA-binding MarR family transcriptional regulator
MGAAKTKPGGTGPSGRQPLPPLIHGRVRLLVLSFLVRAARPVTFTETRKALGLTDGSLSVNLSKLEEGGLVEIVKGFAGRRPRTAVRLTAEGRRRFALYVADLQEIVPGLAQD